MTGGKFRPLFRVAAAALLLAGAVPAFGADDAVARGTRFYERHQYGEAAGVLRPYLSSAGSGTPGQAALILGAAYLRNAALHRALHRTSVAVQVDYLRKLAGEKGRDGSALADLYLGEALLAAGNPGKAGEALRRFLAKPGRGTADKAFASITLGLCHHRLGDAKKAAEIWGGVDAADPDVKAVLAAAYLTAGRGEKAALSMCREALAALAKSGRKPSTRAVAGILGVYARAGQAENGLDLLAAADLKAFSREEILGKNKVIRFYDLALLDALAAVYGKAAVFWLEKAASDPRSRDAAAYALDEAYAVGGGAPPARAAGASVPASQMPKGVRDRAAVRQAAGRYAAGGKGEAMRLWDELSRKQPADPDLLAEIVAACDRVDAGCQAIVGRAAALAEAGGGKRYRALHATLGRHYLDRKDAPKALFHLESGRDKGNKNKVESNDPEMLAGLAEAYYRTRNFSEAQEIYFGMSRSFPAVRQIQEALQGIYSREQRSPGDARIL